MKSVFLLLGAVSGALLTGRQQNFAPLDVESDSFLQTTADFASSAEACDACNGSHTKKNGAEGAMCYGFQDSGKHHWFLGTNAPLASNKLSDEADVCVCNINDQTNNGKTTCQAVVEGEGK